MSTNKNRFHRACANVEGYLNYTKSKYFLLLEVVEDVCGFRAKLQLSANIHSFPEPAREPIVQISTKFIAMSPLDCAVACLNPDQ